MLCILLLASPLNLMVNLMLAAAQSVWVVTPTADLAGAMVTISSRLQSLVGDSPTFSPDDVYNGRETDAYFWFHVSVCCIHSYWSLQTWWGGVLRQIHICGRQVSLAICLLAPVAWRLIPLVRITSFSRTLLCFWLLISAFQPALMKMIQWYG